MSKSKTSANKMKAAERRMKGVTLRKAGYTMQEVADQLGCSKATISRDLNRLLSEYSDMTEEQVAEMRALWNVRLESLLKNLWAKAQAGNLGAVDRVLKVAERVSKLNSLDKPAKVAPTTPDGNSPWQPADDMTMEEVDARIAEILKSARENGVAHTAGNAGEGGSQADS